VREAQFAMGRHAFIERFLAACALVLFVVEPRISAVLARVVAFS
jgi:hypothetical protein